jgi:hypothetical protein
LSFLRGAVKSNIGHLEGASGLAGVIKAVLVLENGIIPPNANFEKLNPKIDAEYLRLKVGFSEQDIWIVLDCMWLQQLTLNESSLKNASHGRALVYVEHQSHPLATVELMPTWYLTMRTTFSD